MQYRVRGTRGFTELLKGAGTIHYTAVRRDLHGADVGASQADPDRVMQGFSVLQAGGMNAVGGEA